MHAGLASSYTKIKIQNMIFQEKFGVAFKKSNIDKQKVFFEFLISPISIPDEMIHFEYCQLSYNEVQWRRIHNMSSGATAPLLCIGGGWVGHVPGH